MKCPKCNTEVIFKLEKQLPSCTSCRYTFSLSILSEHVEKGEISSTEFIKFYSNLISPVPKLTTLFATSCPNAENVHVATETLFFHYDCCGELDFGWGCAYRCLQMILSNLAIRGYSNKILKFGKDVVLGMPSIYEIQEALAQVGNIKKESIGTTLWIEPPNAAVYLRSCCKNGGFTCQEYVLIEESTKKDAPVPIVGSKQFKKILLDHFSTYKTPVMIDNEIKAYVIAGIRTLGDKIQLLRFDPHVNANLKYENFVEMVKKTDVNNTSMGIGVQWMDYEKVFYSPRWMIMFPTVN